MSLASVVALTQWLGECDCTLCGKRILWETCHALALLLYPCHTQAGCPNTTPQAQNGKPVYAFLQDHLKKDDDGVTLRSLLRSDIVGLLCRPLSAGTLCTFSARLAGPATSCSMASLWGPGRCEAASSPTAHPSCRSNKCRCCARDPN